MFWWTSNRNINNYRVLMISNSPSVWSGQSLKSVYFIQEYAKSIPKHMFCCTCSNNTEQTIQKNMIWHKSPGVLGVPWNHVFLPLIFDNLMGPGQDDLDFGRFVRLSLILIDLDWFGCDFIKKVQKLLKTLNFIKIRGRHLFVVCAPNHRGKGRESPKLKCC